MLFDPQYRPLPPASSPVVSPQERRRPTRRRAAAFGAAAALVLAAVGAAPASANTPTDAQGVADQIFQSSAVSAGSVGTFARNGEALSLADGFDTDPLDDAELASGFEPADLTGDGLENTVGALSVGGDTRKLSGTKKPAALLTFWQEAEAIDGGQVDGSSEAAIAAAAIAAGPANVLIPLPLSAWSALSLMGGCGVFAGVRKLCRRFR